MKSATSSSKRRCSTWRAGKRWLGFGCSVATPAMPPTPTVTAATKRRELRAPAATHQRDGGRHARDRWDPRSCRGAPPYARLWRRWQHLEAKTTASIRSGWRMPSSNSPTTPWTPAGCRRSAAVKPHVSLTTTLEALKGELGAPARRSRALATGVRQDARALCLRLHDVASAARGLTGHRRGAGDAGRFRTGQAGAPSSRYRLPVPRLRSVHQLDQPASHRVLGQGRFNQRARPDLGLPLPSSPGP